MIVDGAQRWNRGRSSYRPAGEPLRTVDYDVASIGSDNVAKAFVLEHHYAGSYPAARFRFGLYHRAQLCGVAVFSVPFQPLALACLPGTDAERVELGRFVLRDEVPANAESWMIARCFELLQREGIAGVVAFSDPCRRVDAAGALVFRGHVGTIYQATNATYLGRSKSRTQMVLPDGTLLHRRALAKLRTGERGWRYVAAMLTRHGADELVAPAHADEWMAEWLPRLVRAQLHPGNHKYAWCLRRRDRGRLPASKPYPKLVLG